MRRDQSPPSGIRNQPVEPRRCPPAGIRAGPAALATPYPGAWSAGSGADASPYFRIFNPVTRSKKFDAAGRYLREYLPELAGLAGKRSMNRGGQRGPGPGYPAPVVGLPESRARALEAYRRLKDG